MKLKSRSVHTHLLATLIAFIILAFSSHGQCREFLIGLAGAGTGSSVETPPVAILYLLDPRTGNVLRTIGSTGQPHLAAMAFDPVGKTMLAYKSDNATDDYALFSLSLATGLASRLSPPNTSTSGVPDMTTRPGTGAIYAWYDGFDLAVLDKDSGILNVVGDSGIVGTPKAGLAFAPNGILYMKTNANLYTVDPATGTLTGGPVMLSDVPDNILEFSPAGILYTGLRTGNSTTIYTVNTATGELTVVGSVADRISALTFIDVADPTLKIKGKSKKTVPQSRGSINVKGNANAGLPISFVRYKASGKRYRSLQVNSNGNFSKRIRFDSKRTTVKFSAVHQLGVISPVKRVRLVRS